MMRKITERQAREIVKILVEECGHRVHHERDADTFVRAITVPSPPDYLACREYRFCGELGFGGKFRNNGNHDNTPHVDCYPEHETPERRAMIAAANTRIAALFDAPFDTQQTAPEKS